MGVDIAPGTYRSEGGDQCYWERQRSFSGGFDAIISNDNPRGPAIVTIAATDAGFKTSDCGAWRQG